MQDKPSTVSNYPELVALLMCDGGVDQPVRAQMPVLHLNGTSKAALVQKNRRALDAVDIAIEALQDAMPHGRDYYPAGPAAYPVARAAHALRLRALEHIKEQLIEIIVSMNGRRV
jgi:hypothetical protein